MYCKRELDVVEFDVKFWRYIRKYKTWYSSLAQSVEHSAVNRVVVGSSPTGGVCHVTKQWRQVRLLGQAVKTSPFHGGNTGSIPVGVTWVNTRQLNMAPWPSGKAKVCNTSITSSNLVGALRAQSFLWALFLLKKIYLCYPLYFCF